MSYFCEIIASNIRFTIRGSSFIKIDDSLSYLISRREKGKKKKKCEMNLWLWRDGCLAWPILGHQGRQEKLARLADAADHHLLREISWNILGNVFSGNIRISEEVED